MPAPTATRTQPPAESATLCLHRPWFPHARAAHLPPCSRPCPERARPFVLAATILGSSMAFIDGTVVNIALPAIQESFDADFALLQWVVNAYTLMLGALILTGGALGDRLGRRAVFVAGIGLFTLASIVCALAPSAEWLVGARIAQGVGAALLVPQSLAIIAAAFPRDVRGRAIGIWAAAAAITTAAGPIVGGAFIDWLSWRAVFWINIPLAIVAVVLALGFVPESRGEASRRLDWQGGVLATAGLALVIYAMTAAPERGFGDAGLMAFAVAGIVALIGFVWLEQLTREPLMPLAIFRAPGFAAANGVTLCLYFALSGVLFLLPYGLIQTRDYSGMEVGAALLPFGVVMALFSSRAGALADRYGPRWPLAAGSALVALACLTFATIEGPDDPGYWTGYFPAILLLSVGMTVCVAPLTTAVMNAVSDRESGTASGINNAVSRLAGVIAVAVVGMAAIVAFSEALAETLAGIELAGAAKTELLANADKLAALDVPGGVDAGVEQQVRNAIAAAFRSGYRIGMLVSAACAALAAGLAWFYLPGAENRYDQGN